MKEQTLSVKAIEQGTVIDHIPEGQGLSLLHHFHLNQLGECVTVGFNLKSKQNHFKDLIKIENILFTESEASQIALFAPYATINVIKNFKVVEKFHPKLPTQVNSLFSCLNENCASHGEPVKSLFYVKQDKELTHLKCHYCEKTYPFHSFQKNKK